ncbi:DMT family transporter [bacterium]|nr:DMT family transporter [bacterium]
MGIFWSIVSAIGYSLDPIFMARFYRRSSPLQAVALRGLALAISGSPLLFFCSVGDFVRVPAFILLLGIAAFCAIIANWGFANSVRYFPVGISSALVSGMQTVILVALSWVLFSEKLEISSLAIIGAIVVINFLMANQRYRSNDTLSDAPLVGFSYAAVNGIFQSFSFFLMAYVARELNPFLASYLWEALIGFFAGGIVFLSTVRNPHRERMCFREFGQILISSSPTILGTLGYAFAATQIPLGIVAAIVSTYVLISSVLGSLIHGERLTSVQWLLLGLVMLLICLLRAA